MRACEDPKGLRKVCARAVVHRNVNPHLDMCLMRVVEQLKPGASALLAKW